MTKDEVKQYQAIVKKVFEFFLERCKSPPTTAEEWHETAMAAERVNSSYLGSGYEDFCVRLLSAVMLELETIGKTGGE